MDEIVYMVARGVRALRQVQSRKFAFLGLFFVCLWGSFSLLAELDLLPNHPLGIRSNPAAVATAPLAVASLPISAMPIEDPVSIRVPAIGLDTVISNPTTTNIATLDALLLKGAVRYPTGAKLGEEGNVVLFGHSSYLPVVKNPAYKAFNDIQKLHVGDTITVSSATRSYTYRVRTVEKESAENGAIPLGVTGRVLTLATCDSFGKKSDRFVVTADLVESYPAGA